MDIEKFDHSLNVVVDLTILEIRSPQIGKQSTKIMQKMQISHTLQLNNVLPAPYVSLYFTILHLNLYAEQLSK